MDFKIKIRNKEYHVLLKEEAGRLKVKIGEKEFVFGKAKAASLSLTKNESLKKDIVSSLSGVIISIFVKEGDNIKANQKVLILSAMKMENEIVSESDGKIKKILVKEGQQVKEGEILIILE